MKAQRLSFKTESESGQSAVNQYIEIEPVPEEPVKNTRSKVQTASVILNNEAPVTSKSMPAPSRYPAKVKSYEVIVGNMDSINDFSDEDDVSLMRELENF